MNIDEVDTDYETVKIDRIGIADSLTGKVVLKDKKKLNFLCLIFHLKLQGLFRLKFHI